jgi:catechol 2,3-dioxygenase-like lactoylglutathione lyase family enzyme
MLLKQINGVQIAVNDRAAAERTVTDIFGAELVKRDVVPPLSAKCSIMQAGISLIVLLEPDGAGPVQKFLAKGGGGLFGVSFSVMDMAAAKSHFTKLGVSFEEAGGQLFLATSATFGMRTMISQYEERKPVGLIEGIHGVTNLVDDWKVAAERYARIFALDSSKFTMVEHREELREFGYTGTDVMLNPPEQIDRIHLVQITDYETPLGLYCRHRGNCLIMFFAKTSHLDAIKKRLLEQSAARHPIHRGAASIASIFGHPEATPGAPEKRFLEQSGPLSLFDPYASARASTVYIHPSLFLGTFVGVSCTGFA